MTRHFVTEQKFNPGTYWMHT